MGSFIPVLWSKPISDLDSVLFAMKYDFELKNDAALFNLDKCSIIICLSEFTSEVSLSIFDSTLFEIHCDGFSGYTFGFFLAPYLDKLSFPFDIDTDEFVKDEEVD